MLNTIIDVVATVDFGGVMVVGMFLTLVTGVVYIINKDVEG